MLYLFDPNVSLIDIGFRIRDRQNRKIEDELCIRVHVRRKLRGAALEEFAERSPERLIDPEKIGFAVDVPQATYKLRQWLPGSRTTASTSRSQMFNPMQGGISISNAIKYGYGTLGCKVIDRQTKAEMILSNWHVLAGSWYAWPGLAIYQPGQGDGGTSAQTVAHLTRDAMDQFIDAAVAKLDGTRPLDNTQFELGAVTGVASPQLGMRIQKSGRRTGITTGIVTGIEGRQAMYYDGIQRVIRNVMHIAQTEDGQEVSAAGDSGSCWVEEDTRRAVGLHFAGSDEPEYGLAISMSQVLDALNVDLAL